MTTAGHGPGAGAGRASRGMLIAELSTPCALVELSRLRENAAAFRRRARSLGVVLRPHVKTHKCVEVAKVQHGGTLGPITVSTLAEARAFVAAGCSDLIWAVPPAACRLAELVELASAVARCDVVVDHPATAAALAAAGAAHGLVLGVFLKVDCGAGRAGVRPDSEQALLLARQIADTPELRLRGLLTHAGQAYRCCNRAEIEAVARDERDALLALARRLRSTAIAVDELSVGSTPTFVAVDHLTGISEARPGNYAFFDALQVAIGSCTLEQVAFSVLATVIGHYPERRELLVDAGTLALSADPGPLQVDAGCGFGVLLGEDQTPLPGLHVRSLTQEHGLLRGVDRAAVAAHPMGSRLRIIPNHSCLAAACFDRYHIMDGDQVVDVWYRGRGW